MIELWHSSTLCCILTLLYQIDSIENCRDYYKFCVISLSHHGERHGDEFSSMSNKCGRSLSFRVDCQKYLLSLCIFSGSSHLSNCHSRLNLFNSYVFPKPTHPTLLLNYILMWKNAHPNYLITIQLLKKCTSHFLHYTSHL